jgi:hypothetical protein
VRQADRDEKITTSLCADAHGFSLHAGGDVARIGSRTSNGCAGYINRFESADGRFLARAMTG